MLHHSLTCYLSFFSPHAVSSKSKETFSQENPPGNMRHRLGKREASCQISFSSCLFLPLIWVEGTHFCKNLRETECCKVFFTAKSIYMSTFPTKDDGRKEKQTEIGRGVNARKTRAPNICPLFTTKQNPKQEKEGEEDNPQVMSACSRSA